MTHATGADSKGPVGTGNPSITHFARIRDDLSFPNDRDGGDQPEPPARFLALRLAAVFPAVKSMRADRRFS
jgi:hypothetical protein